MKRFLVLLFSVIAVFSLVACTEEDKSVVEENTSTLEESTFEDTDEENEDYFDILENIGDDDSVRAYQYEENEGIFIFYKTEDEELYRELLPEEFDMPDELTVHLFIMDFYEIDSSAEPYKEMSISLLGELDGEEIWHCIYMPVTSQQSMIAGVLGLGLPKTIGDIEFIRAESSYSGTVLDENNRTATITVDTEDYLMSEAEREIIRGYMSIPKINILNGELIQMTRTGGSVNIIDIAEQYPRYVTLLGGEVIVDFISYEDGNHPLDLEPSEVIAGYFLHNEISFSLDRKE